ncbi:hypothetical protein JMJ35_005362 [Cladonia borealis]|uniref:Radical SAM core domain-containing protein n=1 Tax=Cladonia borealis TaxID=184061 RepID=A0AA39V578_9LECA|nr:hypothetical protein JMJ35_005362 [Cladonia borealis]
MARMPYPLRSPVRSPARLTSHLLEPTRHLHLAPPFLLDNHTPRYLSLPPTTITHKYSLCHTHLLNCNLCPRLCSTNRYQTTGYCLIPATTVSINTLAPHFGEEPCIQGHNGSGAVFFSGCNLRCVFCQNWDIAHRKNGFDVTPEELGGWMVKLQEVGKVHNINFVTGEHVVPQVVQAVLAAREKGLKVPIIYNTSAFDSLESLELLGGVVDIYLPDFKVWRAESSKRLLKAEDYARVARESIKKMYEQVGDLCFTGDGIAKKGVLLRHLVMPGMEEEGKEIMRWVAGEVSRDMFVNIMEQYRPDAHVGKSARSTKASLGSEQLDGVAVTEQDGERSATTKVRYSEINRPVTGEEVSSVRRAAEDAGLWRFCDPVRHDGFNI